MTTPTTPATDVKRYEIKIGSTPSCPDYWIDEDLVGQEVVLASAFDALAAELTHARYTIEALRQQCKAEIELRDAATAEVGRLRADAARYRLLREYTMPRYLADRLGIVWKDIPTSQSIEEKIDELIDVTMSLAPSPTNSDGANSEV